MPSSIQPRIAPRELGAHDGDGQFVAPLVGQLLGVGGDALGGGDGAVAERRPVRTVGCPYAAPSRRSKTQPIEAQRALLVLLERSGDGGRRGAAFGGLGLIEAGVGLVDHRVGAGGGEPNAGADRDW